MGMGGEETRVAVLQRVVKGVVLGERMEGLASGDPQFMMEEIDLQGVGGGRGVEEEVEGVGGLIRILRDVTGRGL